MEFASNHAPNPPNNNAGVSHPGESVRVGDREAVAGRNSSQAPDRHCPSGQTFGARLRSCPPQERLTEIQGFLEELARDQEGVDVLSALVRHAQTVAGPRVAPEEDPRRRRLQAVLRAGAWYCLEEVPCGRKTCRKQPDLHGPYWYRYDYEEAQRRWRSRYLGKEDIFDPATSDPTAALSAELEPLLTVVEPTAADIERCRRGLQRLSALSTSQAKDLRRRLKALQTSWLAAREQALDEEYAALSARAAAGERLSPGQRSRLDEISEILSSQH